MRVSPHPRERVRLGRDQRGRLHLRHLLRHLLTGYTFVKVGSPPGATPLAELSLPGILAPPPPLERETSSEQRVLRDNHCRQNVYTRRNDNGHPKRIHSAYSPLDSPPSCRADSLPKNSRVDDSSLEPRSSVLAHPQSALRPRAPCSQLGNRHARRRLPLRCTHCVSTPSRSRCRSRSRSRSRWQRRGQGWMRCTLRPNRRRTSTGASSLRTPSSSSTAGQKT